MSETKIYTIDQLDEGDIAYDPDYGYSRVKLCVHGNPYYAYVDHTDPKEGIVHEVRDTEDVELTCGC